MAARSGLKVAQDKIDLGPVTFQFFHSTAASHLPWGQQDHMWGPWH